MRERERGDWGGGMRSERRRVKERKKKAILEQKSISVVQYTFLTATVAHFNVLVKKKTKNKREEREKRERERERERKREREREGGG